MLDWSRIDVVLLDMDGTLLDLHFDNRFWRDHLPRAWARREGLAPEQGLDALTPRLRAVEGTLDWYCLDYWGRELGLDLPSMKREISHLIRFRPGARDFLARLRARGIASRLVTNAHGDSLSLKRELTGLDDLVDEVVCAHDLGHPKESIEFWHALREHHPFDPARALLVDDSLGVLGTARRYGVAQLLAVRRPDTESGPRDTGEFQPLDSFAEIMP